MEDWVYCLTWYLLLPKLFGFGIPLILHLECPKGRFLYSIWYKNIPLPHFGFLFPQYQWFSTPGPCQKVMLGKRLMEQEKPNYHIVFYYWGLAWVRGLLFQGIKCIIGKVSAIMWPLTNCQLPVKFESAIWAANMKYDGLTVRGQYLFIFDRFVTILSTHAIFFYETRIG